MDIWQIAVSVFLIFLLGFTIGCHVMAESYPTALGLFSLVIMQACFIQRQLLELKRAARKGKE